MKTLIQGGDVVAYAEDGHRLLRGGALVFENDRVTFVGRSFTGSVDRRIDAGLRGGGGQQERQIMPLVLGGDVVPDAQAGDRLPGGGALVYENGRGTFVGRSGTGPVDGRIREFGSRQAPGLVVLVIEL